MPGPTVAFLSTPETGHFARLKAVIAGVVAAGGRAEVFTDARFREAVESCGRSFHDLYGRLPIERADAESVPWSCRHVTYAGRFTDEVAAELAPVRPAVVVHDSFSVVSPLAARALDVPSVCVCSGHNLHPKRFVEALHRDVAVRVSAACREAVAVLARRHGMEDASPFSYMATRSPWLNLYCEPEEYIDAGMRERLAPVAFFGSLGSEEPERRATGLFGSGGDGVRRVYVSFGTVIWRFYAAEAIAALRAVVTALARRGDLRVVVSLGGYGGPVPDLVAPGVRVVPYVDQWQVLGEADLFVTHHGMNSTHEAAFLGVPMLSYPFFWDQPALAEWCAELGIAEPLARRVRAPITPEDVDRALARLEARGAAVRAALAEAGAWERRVVAGRGAVIGRILDLAAG